MQSIAATEERSENFEMNNSAGTKVSAEYAGGHDPGTGEEIPLQPGEDHGEAAMTLQPMKVHRAAEIDLQPLENSTKEQVDT